jgi:hypothetical protein
VGSDRFIGVWHGSARQVSRRLSLVVGLALAVLFTVPGPSSFAAVPNLERIFADTASNSSNKSVTASCPSGKRVVGAGAELGGTLGQVVLGSLRPDATLSSVTVQGREDENGTANSWSARASAICAPPLPGLERVSAASPSNSSNKGVTATCSAGKRLLGAGAEIEGGGGHVSPNDIIPGETLKGVTVQGLEDENGTAANWRARAYAICAAPVAGIQRVAATSSTSSSSTKQVSANCPVGKQVVGAGAELGGGRGEVVLDDLAVDSGQQSVVVTGLEDEDGTSANWFARAFAICAAASERIVATSPIGQFEREVVATCPAGMQVTGGGGDIGAGGGRVLIEAIRPSATSVTVSDQKFVFASPGAFWLLRAYAICATPLPGLAVVSSSSPTDLNSPKSVTAICPSGKRVVGAGGEVVVNGAGTGLVVLDAVAAAADLSGVSATAEGGDPDPWSVTAHAVCANPPPGLELVSATSDPDNFDVSASATATCPDGKNLLGTGVDIAGGLGHVLLDDLRPNAALTSATATGHARESASLFDWTVTAQAICANP